MLLVDVSAWTGTQDFGTFLIDYTTRSYGADPWAVAAWLDSQVVTVIIDGLDELGSSENSISLVARRALVASLKDWCATDHRWVLTCRVDEWYALDIQAPSRHTVEIQPLSDSQVTSVMEALGFDPTSSTNSRVKTLLRTPLFSSLALETAPSPDAAGAAIDLEDALVERYAQQRLVGQDPLARQYLTWIADFLEGTTVTRWGHTSPDTTVFSAPNLTPPLAPLSLRIWIGVFTAVFGGVFESMGTSVVIGVVSGWMVADARPFRFHIDPSQLRRSGVWVRAVFGAVFWGVQTGVFMGVIFTLFAAVMRPEAVVLAESFDEPRRRSRVGVFWGVVVGVFWAVFGSVQAGVVWGVVLGLLVISSAEAVFLLAQFLAQRQARREGAIPAQLSEFLSAMATSGLLRSTGLGYRFRHAAIQAYFRTPTASAPRSSTDT